MLKNETVVVALKLLIITSVAALCLAFVNKITAPVIEKNRLITIEATQKEVLENAESFEKIKDLSSVDLSENDTNGTYIEELYRGISSDGSTEGYVVSAVSSRGYGGDIKVMVGINKDMKINRVKITQSSETAGLGQKASNPEFIDQFNGRENELEVQKNIEPTESGATIAAISGATVTSKAVTNAVNLALEFAKGYETSGALENKADIENIKESIDKETERQMQEGE